MRRRPAGIHLAVALGSALGSIFRYLVSLGMVTAFGPVFPWGTLTVNALGSFLIGLYARLTDTDGRLFVRPATRHFVLTGFCGGFTTLSIFNLETLRLAQLNAPGLAGMNVVVSLAVWMAAVWMGSRVGQTLNRLPRQ